MSNNQVTYLRHQQLGEVKVVKNSRAKNLKLKITSEQGLTIVSPIGLNEDFLLDMLNRKQTWIKYHLSKIEEARSRKTIFTEATEFKTYAHQLKILTHKKPTIKAVVSGPWIVVWYPEGREVTVEPIQEFIRSAIEETWRVEAKRFIPVRVAELAKQHGFSYHQVSIKKVRTRWGSCSAKGNLNFNLQIMRLSAEERDYLILHELTHTQVPNHGPQFWKRLEEAIPGARKIDTQLNKYRLDIW